MNLKFSKKKSLKSETENCKKNQTWFVRIIGSKIQEKFETFRLRFVGEVAF